MDWKIDVATNLWVFPSGVQRSGKVGPNSIMWLSKYGSAIASGYDIATTDDINEAGLAANLLWLVESEYPASSSSEPGLTIAAWSQYVLDNYGTVVEAVDALRDEPFTLVTSMVAWRQSFSNPSSVYIRCVRGQPLSNILKANNLSTMIESFRR